MVGQGHWVAISTKPAERGKDYKVQVRDSDGKLFVDVAFFGKFGTWIRSGQPEDHIVSWWSES